MATTSASMMMFGEIESTTNRALAYAILLSQAAHAYIEAIVSTKEMAKALENLIAVLPAQTLARLTPDQKTWLTPRLQEIHKYLVAGAHSQEAAAVRRLPILCGWMRKIEDNTEDLSDIIEDLVLVDDADFRNLLAVCERSILTREGEPIGAVRG